MAKKKANSGKEAVTKQVNVPREQKTAAIQPKTGDSKGFLARYANVLIMAGIAVVTFLFLKTCMDNQLTNWDDPGYVRDNGLIKDLSSQGIKNIFSTSIMGNYHPLTILTYAYEYGQVRLEPYLYHRDSLLLHIATTLLLFWLTYMLTRKTIAATVTALLFGLHPMHMESVAWIASRKDVLYGLFYAASCICYLYYCQAKGAGKWGLYLLAMLLFVASLLSKPVAVSLPLALLAMDYFWQRKFFATHIYHNPTPAESGTKFSPIIYLEKIPFFLLAVGFGLRSVADQKEFKALNTMDVHFNILERLSLGTYALGSYLVKAVLPYGLSNFYPYPEKAANTLPFIYYLCPVAIAAIVFVLWRFARNKSTIVFGFLFFIANILLLLQFIPVGGAILADRYTYIPYYGLFFIAGWYVALAFEDKAKPAIGKAVLGGTLGYILVLGVLSNQRCQVWYDTISLWRDEVAKHPDVPSAFNNLGFEYFNRGNLNPDPKTRELYFDSSNLLLKEAIRLQPNFVNPYVSLGEVARTRNDFPTAKLYYYKALSISKSDETHNAYLGLAIIYCITGQQAAVAGLQPMPYFDSAQYCFRSALRVKPYFPEAHSNYGNFFDMMHNFDSSLKEYTLSIEQNPDMYASYLNRARLLQRHNKCDEAFKDFTKALEVSPDMGEIYYSRSYCFMQKGDRKRALEDVEHGRSLGYTQIDPAYYQELKR